jgi:hypothetical protein
MGWGHSYQTLDFPGAWRGSGYDPGEQYNDSCFDAMGFANFSSAPTVKRGIKELSQPTVNLVVTRLERFRRWSWQLGARNVQGLEPPISPLSETVTTTVRFIVTIEAEESL